jgi:hypothetical protein
MNVHDMNPARDWTAQFRFSDKPKTFIETVDFIKRVQHDALLAALSLSDDIGKGLIIKLMQEHGLEIELGKKEPKLS